PFVHHVVIQFPGEPPDAVWATAANVAARPDRAGIDPVRLRRGAGRPLLRLRAHRVLRAAGCGVPARVSSGDGSAGGGRGGAEGGADYLRPGRRGGAEGDRGWRVWQGIPPPPRPRYRYGRPRTAVPDGQR